MSQVTSDDSHLLMFGELLAHLRQRGFTVGVDQYLRLQVLLERIGGNCAPGQLRTLLCPIFATNQKQQEQFHRAFEEHFALFLPEVNTLAKTLKPPPKFSQEPAGAARRKRRTWIYSGVTILLAVLAVVVAYYHLRPPAKVTPQAQAGAESPLLTVAEKPGVVLNPTAGETPATQLVTPPSKWQNLVNRYLILLQLAAVLAPLALFFLYEWHRFRHRKIILQKEREKQPPYSWPVRVDVEERNLFDNEHFYAAARLMRRRQTAEFYHLDIEATVVATMQALGFPSLRFKSGSKVPEYLVLIERASYRDHQARLFDELVRALEGEGVFVERYFYDHDPRICQNEKGQATAHLIELQNKFGAHRLLIFGSGDEMVGEVTGTLEEWTSVFAHWSNRAVLTLEDPSRWGVREFALAKLFVILPATLKGLLALVDIFEAAVPTDPLICSSSALAAPTRWGDDAEVQIEVLRQSLGEEAFQWLCACAVYPELHWDLTLQLGQLSCMPRGLTREENLLRLMRLIWFRSGTLPDELRWRLVRALDPACEKAIRAAIIDVLEKNPAPPKTFAADEYQLNLFAQRWLHSRTRRPLRELLRLMRRLPRDLALRDYTLLRLLETVPLTPLHFVLPERLKKLFYQRGVPAFGLKTSARFAIALVLTVALWGALRALSTPTPIPDNKDIRAASFEPVPDLDLRTLDNEQFPVSRLRGKVVLLNLWATRCIPCLEEMVPVLNDLNRTAEERELIIVGISTYDTPEMIVDLKKISKRKLDYLLLVGGADVADKLKAGPSLPVTFVIDREGRIRGTFFGTQDRAALEAAIQPLLNAPTGMLAGNSPSSLPPLASANENTEGRPADGSGIISNHNSASATRQYVNSREGRTGNLADNFVDFSFYYPDNWEIDEDPAPNFVRVERKLVDDSGTFTLENFAVGWVSATGTALDKQLMPKLATQFNTQFAAQFPNYKKVSEGETKIGAYEGYEFRFTAEKNNVEFWGRVVMLPPPAGQKKGVALVMIGSDLAPELLGVDDIGEKGELPVILESFRFGSKGGSN